VGVFSLGARSLGLGLVAKDSVFGGVCCCRMTPRYRDGELCNCPLQKKRNNGPIWIIENVSNTADNVPETDHPLLVDIKSNFKMLDPRSGLSEIISSGTYIGDTRHEICISCLINPGEDILRDGWLSEMTDLIDEVEILIGMMMETADTAYRLYYVSQFRNIYPNNLNFIMVTNIEVIQ